MKNIIIYLVCAVMCLVPNVYKIVQGHFSFLSLLFILFGGLFLLSAVFLFVNRKKLDEIQKTKETGKSSFQRKLEEAAKRKR